MKGAEVASGRRRSAGPEPSVSKQSPDPSPNPLVPRPVLAAAMGVIFLIEIAGLWVLWARLG